MHHAPRVFVVLVQASRCLAHFEVTFSSELAGAKNLHSFHL